VSVHESGTIARIVRSRSARQLAAVIAVVLAFLLRQALARQGISLPTYVTFYPVVLLAALLGGVWTGLLATALSAFFVDYFVLPPIGHFSIGSTSDIVAMAIFCISGVSISVIAELYYRSREKLAAYQMEAAVLNERRKVEEALEQAEIVRAERLRFLHVLETLRTMDSSTASSVAVPISGEFSAAGRESRFPSLDQTKFRALLRRTIIVPFMTALILAGAVLWVAYNLNASMQWVDHTDQEIGGSQRVLGLLVDMETGERGYLVTGNDVFLQPYREASNAIDSEYQALHRLVADNPPQQAQLERLYDSLHHWQRYAEHMIDLRRTGGAYTSLYVNMAGKAEMDEIRDQLAGFQSVEEHLRDERNRMAHRNWILVEAICILFGLGGGAGLAIFTRRRMKVIAASFEKAGRALAESERRWATTLASIGDAVISADTQGRVTFLNPAASALTGWQYDEAQGQPMQIVFQTINEKTRLPAEDIVNRVLREKRVVELANHTALLAKDGREILIEDSAAPIPDRDGNIAGVVLVFRDVTERKRAEEFKQSSQYTRSLVEASMDPLVTISPDGKVTDVNEATVQVTGVAREKLVGTDFADYFTEPEKAREGYRRVFSEGFVTDYPLMIRHAKGRLTEVLYNASVYKDAGGNVLGVFAAARDVTALKQTEASLKANVTELARSNGDLQQFAYVASHDLQEPLRTISSFSQLLARRYQSKLDSDADEFLAFIVDGALRMQTLINDLLAFSRVGTRGNLFGPVNCEEILHSAEENLKTAIEESGAVITHDSLPVLMADKLQLTQLFQNLLGNAIKFRRPEEPPRIQVSARRMDGAWQFSVRDNGIGINPQYFDRIFIIFQRLHGREQYTGTGIGLAICKKIVERHGGRLWVESESGSGSIFHFTIPGENSIGEGYIYDESSQRN